MVALTAKRGKEFGDGLILLPATSCLRCLSHTDILHRVTHKVYGVLMADQVIFLENLEERIMK
jgi:hypothetical protein